MSTAAETRPDPDALLAAANAEGRGKLKVFLGSAPGVGKTYTMLAQANRRLVDGEDVVAGVIETHGRAETEHQIGAIPILPRSVIPYRGQTLQEFDLEAALVRRPGLLLVDELAHTNAPGSRHAKRWEDVVELLDAGLDIWATLNVQHLESLNDDVARITGVRVTETLPDRVLELADEIELIDLPPADLRARLQEGRIYRPDTAKRALDGFFQEGNLASLREIALRRAAAHVDGDVRNWLRRNRVSGPWPVAECVLVLVAADAGADAVVRHAKRLADALRAPWVALHVERPGTAELARAPLLLASQLGAEIEVRAGEDLVGVALEAARARNATQIVIGRAPAPLWRRLAGRTLGLQLLRRAPDYALHVVPVTSAPRRRPRVIAPMPWAAWAIATAAVAAVTVVGRLLDGIVPGDAMGMVFLALVVAAASLRGLGLALFTAALGFFAWDIGFIPPVGSLTIGSPSDLIALVVFTLVAVVTGGLAGKLRREAKGGQSRIEGLRRIAAFSRKLAAAPTEFELLAEIARQAASVVGEAVVLLETDAGLTIQASEPASASLDDGAWAAARWCYDQAEPAGRGTSTLPSTAWRFLPMRTVRGLLGVIGVRAVVEDMVPASLQALETLADQSAVSLERVRLAGQAARGAALEETQKLRTALLASLSHDLRTPLAGIRGAAETLRASWDDLAPAVRTDLLASVEQDTGRMTRFLANITDLTRLESGQITPRVAPVAVAEVIEAAVARVPDAVHTRVSLPDVPPVVRADGALLEQALVNVLDNATRYAPAGSVIAVRVTQRGALATIAVVDEGVGIAPEDLPHVFDSFTRAKRGDRVAPGTGLGLAIARGMVEAMGGTIFAASPRPDAPRGGAPGTVITISLPV